LYSSIFLRVIHSRKVQFAGHVACMGEKRKAQKLFKKYEQNTQK
jgi:hypothetical protein